MERSTTCCPYVAGVEGHPARRTTQDKPSRPAPEGGAYGRRDDMSYRAIKIARILGATKIRPYVAPVTSARIPIDTSLLIAVFVLTCLMRQVAWSISRPHRLIASRPVRTSS